jgi:hypothetical protein
LKHKSLQQQFNDAIAACNSLEQKYQLYFAWLQSFSVSQDINVDESLLLEAATLIMLKDEVKFYSSNANTDSVIEGLLGQHNSIIDRKLKLNYQEFIGRLRQFSLQQVPAFKQFHLQKQQVLTEQKQRLKLTQFKPSALSSFVRNKLINDVYFPIIGANLAKQIGSAGSKKTF